MSDSGPSGSGSRYDNSDDENDVHERPMKDMTSREKITELLKCLGSISALAGTPVHPGEGYKHEISNVMLKILQEDPDPHALCLDSFSVGVYSKPRPILHWACHFGLSLPLIQTIHEYNPHSYKSRPESSGLLPLDEALDHRAVGKNFDTVKFLVEAFPESLLQETQHTVTPAESILSRFPPQVSLDLLHKYLSNDQIKRISLKGDAPWTHPDPLPLGVIELVRDIHNLNSMIIRVEAIGRFGFSFRVDEDLQAIIVEVKCDESFDYVVEELLKVPGLPLKAMEVERYETDTIGYLIATLDPSAGGPPPWLGQGAIDFFERYDIPHNPQHLQYQPPSDLDLSSVEKLSVKSRFQSPRQLRMLLEGIERALPNLKVLVLEDPYLRARADELEVVDGCFPRLADRLEEIDIRNTCFRAASLFDLMATSRLLAKVTFFDTSLCMKDPSTFEQLTHLLSENASITHFTLKYETIQGGGGGGGGVETMSNQQVALLVRALQVNVTLQELTLDFAFSEKSGKSLVDVVRKKQNTTLQRFVCTSTSLNKKMNYWCTLNQIEPKLHAEDVDLGGGINILEPYSLEDNIQMTFGILQSRAALWFPSSSTE